jgi:hypothetical protein
VRGGAGSRVQVGFAHPYPMDTHSSFGPSLRVVGEVAIELSLHKYVSHLRKHLQTCHE